MLKSMTGFGRYELLRESTKITVEIKAVNHRYLDLNIKMPKKFGCFENDIRNLLKTYIVRGKVDVFITYEDNKEKQSAIVYNEDIAEEYMKHLNVMSEKFGIKNDISAASLAKFPEVFTMKEQSNDDEELWNMLREAISEAAVRLTDSRIAEGNNLKNDLMAKLDVLDGYVDIVERRSPVILKEYKQKLESKISEVLKDTQIDEARIATELVIFADKICVDEEIVRLRSHIESTRQALCDDASVGRKLDFIAQEMNREANTILSKANDIEVSNIAINVKTDIEKVREQIQNIE